MKQELLIFIIIILTGTQTIKLIEPVFISIIAINSVGLYWVFKQNGENKYLIKDDKERKTKKDKGDK